MQYAARCWLKSHILNNIVIIIVFGIWDWFSFCFMKQCAEQHDPNSDRVYSLIMGWNFEFVELLIIIIISTDAMKSYWMCWHPVNTEERIIIIENEPPTSHIFSSICNFLLLFAMAINRIEMKWFPVIWLNITRKLENNVWRHWNRFHRYFHRIYDLRFIICELNSIFNSTKSMRIIIIYYKNNNFGLIFVFFFCIFHWAYQFHWNL